MMRVSNGEKVDRSYGSPYNRGSVDSRYSRAPDPHYYPNGTYNPPRIGKEQMTPEQIAEYWKGFAENEANPRKGEVG